MGDCFVVLPRNEVDSGIICFFINSSTFINLINLINLITLSTLSTLLTCLLRQPTKKQLELSKHIFEKRKDNTECTDHFWTNWLNI